MKKKKFSVSHIQFGILSPRDVSVNKMMVTCNLQENVLSFVVRMRTGNPNSDNAFVLNAPSDTMEYVLYVLPIHIQTVILVNATQGIYGMIQLLSVKRKSVPKMPKSTT